MGDVPERAMSQAGWLVRGALVVDVQGRGGGGHAMQLLPLQGAFLH